MDINFNNPDLDLDILKSIIRKYSRKDFILIKDNHLNWAKKNNISITVMIEKYREKLDASHIIEIEVESIDDAVEALNSNVDLLLLDNMHVE